MCDVYLTYPVFWKVAVFPSTDKSNVIKPVLLVHLLEQFSVNIPHKVGRFQSNIFISIYNLSQHDCSCGTGGK